MRLIDADALFDMVFAGATINRLMDIKDVIKNAPTIRPAAGEWVPLSEGLPEKGIVIARREDIYDVFLCDGGDVWRSSGGQMEYALSSEKMAKYYTHYAKIKEVE